jgi:hypothetical protein
MVDYGVGVADILTCVSEAISLGLVQSIFCIRM